MPPEWDGLCDKIENEVPGLGMKLRPLWRVDARLHALWDAIPADDWVRFARDRSRGIEGAGNAPEYFTASLPKWFKEQGPARKTPEAPTQYFQAPPDYKPPTCVRRKETV